MKKVLVTGGTGFVGANLVRRLSGEGHEVHLILRPGHNPWRIEGIREKVKLHTADLTHPEAVRAVVSKVRPEWIFHLAVYGAYSSQTDARLMVNTNLMGTINLVEACVDEGFEAFVNTGSSSEYGFKDHPPPETDRVDPNSHYAVSKVAATLYCRHMSISRDVHLTTLRLSSVYGPYEEPTRLIPTLIVKGLDHKLPPLVEPDIARDLIYVDDVVDAFMGVASVGQAKKGAVYNVGSGRQMTLKEIVAVARKTLSIKARPKWGAMPNRQWDTRTWVLDRQKISRDLDWHSAFTFERGFQATVDWLLQSGDMLAFYRKRLL